eukprot:TRINITY_DN778094_c0_g1_i1.p1 TRINITY_DN778094_c0_g1~~TRINITY_DN778094_c0_g1_i1.p1  ORF type:complete len:314 (+),score=89.53 TRINITY_DN778094_c0_g1_i1:145-1086(+)
MDKLTSQLIRLDESSQRIGCCSEIMRTHYFNAEKLTTCWYQMLQQAKPHQALAFLYVANDCLQKSKKKGNSYVEAFSKHIIKAVQFCLNRCPKKHKKVAHLLDVWNRRLVFSKRIMNKFNSEVRPLLLSLQKKSKESFKQQNHDLSSERTHHDLILEALRSNQKCEALTEAQTNKVAESAVLLSNLFADRKPGGEDIIRSTANAALDNLNEFEAHLRHSLDHAPGLASIQRDTVVQLQTRQQELQHQLLEAEKLLQQTKAISFVDENTGEFFLTPGAQNMEVTNVTEAKMDYSAVMPSDDEIMRRNMRMPVRI